MDDGPDNNTLRARSGRVPPEGFISARERTPHKAFLTPYTAEEMRDWRCYLTEDGVGFALTPEGDLVGLINNSGRKEACADAVVWAIREGARTCDCVAGFLDQWYPLFGFSESHRFHWDDELAPRGWDYERYGRNDVVFFRFPDYLSRETTDTALRYRLARIDARAGRSVCGGLHPEWYEEVPDAVRRGLGAPEPGPAPGGAGDAGRDIEALVEWLRKNGVEDLDRLTRIAYVQDQEGDQRLIPLPGGLHGDFSPGDLFWLAVRGPSGDGLSEPLRQRLQTKIDRSLKTLEGVKPDLAGRLSPLLAIPGDE